MRPARFFHVSSESHLMGVAGRIMMPLLDDDRALHIGMELAEVLESPGRVEFLRE